MPPTFHFFESDTVGRMITHDTHQEKMYGPDGNLSLAISSSKPDHNNEAIKPRTWQSCGVPIKLVAGNAMVCPT